MIRADVDDLITFLDSVAKVDPAAMGRLIASRVPCNSALYDHPTVQTGLETGVAVVGLLGILNGYIGTIDEGRFKGWGMVSAIVEKDGRCTGFCRTETAHRQGDGHTGVGK